MAELLVEYETAQEQGEDDIERTSSTAAMLGPTVLYRPKRTMDLGRVPLFGLNRDALLAARWSVNPIHILSFPTFRFCLSRP